MARIKPKSAKARGRRHQQEIRRKICEALDLEEEEVYCASMGAPGVDVEVRGPNKVKFPYSIEAKNCEKWDIPGYWRQAKENTNEGRRPMVVVTKNNHTEYVFMELDDLLGVLKCLLKKSSSKTEQ